VDSVPKFTLTTSPKPSNLARLQYPKSFSSQLRKLQFQFRACRNSHIRRLVSLELPRSYINVSKLSCRTLTTSLAMGIKILPRQRAASLLPLPRLACRRADFTVSFRVNLIHSQCCYNTPSPAALPGSEEDTNPWLNSEPSTRAQTSALPRRQSVQLRSPAPYPPGLILPTGMVHPAPPNETQESVRDPKRSSPVRSLL